MLDIALIHGSGRIVRGVIKMKQMIAQRCWIDALPQNGISASIVSSPKLASRHGERDEISVALTVLGKRAAAMTSRKMRWWCILLDGDSDCVLDSAISLFLDQSHISSTLLPSKFLDLRTCAYGLLLTLDLV